MAPFLGARHSIHSWRQIGKFQAGRVAVARVRHLFGPSSQRTRRNLLVPSRLIPSNLATHHHASYSRPETRAVSTMTMKRTQILVIEDNRLLRDGLAALLDSQAEFKVVASAEGGAAALQRLQDHKPNVVLVDAALGRNRSQRLVESIKEAAPHARIIMMDVLPEEEDVIDFIKRGANGFIAKDAALEDLVNTIRQVANGGDVVPSALTGTLLSHIAKQASVLRNTPMMASVRMTKREQQITDLIAQGPGKKEKPHRRHN